MGSQPTAAQLAQGQHVLTTCPGLRTCFDAAPSLAFSTTGRTNLCRRFRLTDAELTAALAAYRPAASPS